MASTEPFVGLAEAPPRVGPDNSDPIQAQPPARKAQELDSRMEWIFEPSGAISSS